MSLFTLKHPFIRWAMALGALLPWQIAQADTPLTDADWTNFNHTVVRQIVVPGYQQFLGNSLSLNQTTQAYCRGQANLAELQRDFLATQLSWQLVQGWRFGPIEFELRHPRIQTWPDRSNAGGRQLQRLLQTQNVEAISAERLERGSTALQGLPVIERLLYSPELTAQLRSGNEASFGCDFLQQVTQGLVGMGQGLIKNWTDTVEPNRFVFEMLEPSEDNGIFATPFEVSALLINQVITQIQFIENKKLSTPLGIESGKARYRKAESWRSATSLHNIRQNMLVLNEVFSAHYGLGDLLDKHQQSATRALIEAQFSAIDNQLERLGGSLVQALAQHPDELSELHRQLKQLYSLYRHDMLSALGVSEAFNALDGD